MLWRGSFRRNLDDGDLAAYLRPEASAHDALHATTELSRRILRNDPGRTRFYPAVIELAKSQDQEKRKAAAWVMGEDLQEESFSAPLRALLDDPVPLVAHNAALALARHRSDAGRTILLSMLQETPVVAPVDGIFRTKLKVDDTANLQGVIGEIEAAQGKVQIATPVPGRVRMVAADGARFAKGEVVARLGAAQSSALQALRALILPGIGRVGDVAVIEAFLKTTPDLEKEVEEQARATIAQLKR